MRRTPPPAPTASMPWAATILPAQAPRRSRTSKTGVAPPEPTVGSRVEPVETADVATTPAELPIAPPQDEPAAYAPAPFAPAAYAPLAYAPAPAYPPPPPPMPAAAFTPTVAVDRFGIPIAPSAPMASMAPMVMPTTGYPATGGWAPPPPKKGWPVAAKIAVSLMVVGIGIVVAIPVFVNARVKPANRPVTIPATLLGQSQIHSSDLNAQVGQILTDFDQQNPPWQAATGSFYGTEGIPLFFLGAAKLTHQLDSYQEREFFAAPDNVTMSQEGSGPYGGKVECGPLSEDGVPEIVCGSVDNDAVIITVTLNSSMAEAATITREAVSVAEGGSSANL